ncbi:dynein intermediate chain 3, ciliary-like [Sycon ciliatum]|uniref:dynein intermediate chain 3, ciliary-like n=1 Tax=Sycon ciliatum TaxID=27933 RepID=UPI0031F69BEF
MEITSVYSKKRREFGRQCKFSDYTPPASKDGTIEPDPSLLDQYVFKNPCDAACQSAPEMSEHETNTERFETESHGMSHVEGGWPKDINIQEAEQTIRFRKKVEKDEVYMGVIQRLCNTMEHCIKQNNSIDIYEEYFDDVEDNVASAMPEAKVVNIFRDQQKLSRSVASMCWSPDGGSKLAAAYSILDFQRGDPNIKLDSYIWDISNPNRPDMSLKPSSPIVSLEYSPKDAHTVIAGLYNGQVAFWDLRKGSQPVDTSAIEHSHTDAVRRVVYLSAKSGSEFFSTSTDGRVLWWDIRKLSEPYESLDILASKAGKETIGGTALEFESTMPTKFMVGTEQGSIITCNRKGKTPADKIAGYFYGHYGPVYTVQRNPFVPKNFLSIGDWTCRMWSEDIKETSILWTRSDESFLSDGCWSPTRPAVFFTAKQNGYLDTWDLLQNQAAPTLTTQICNSALTSVRVQDQGELMVCGAKNGSITLVELSESLRTAVNNEKSAFTAIMERETRREKILEGRQRELKLKEKQARAPPPEVEAGEGDGDEDPVAKAEADFFHSMKSDLDDLRKRRAKRRGGGDKPEEATSKTETSTSLSAPTGDDVSQKIEALAAKDGGGAETSSEDSSAKPAAVDA